jgi:type IV pilus assembly protein PilQ
MGAIVDSTKYPINYNKIIPALNFKDTDFRDVIRGIATEFKANVSIDNKIDNRISVSLYNISVLNALVVIAKDNNVDLTYDSLRFYIKIRIAKPKPEVPEPEPDISYNAKYNKISLELSSTPINKLVTKLIEVTNKNFLLTPGSNGNVTGKLKNIDFKNGLKSILQNNGFSYVIKDSIYYISRIPTLEDKGGNGPARSVNYTLICNKKNITVEAENIDANRILDDLANQMNLQVVKLATPTHKVTLRSIDTSLDDFLYYIFKGSDITSKIENNVIIVGKSSNKMLDNTKLIKLKYLRVDKMKDKIPDEVYKNVTKSISNEHNAIIVSGTKENVKYIEDYIRTIDKPVPQVMIEALVIDYNLDHLFQMGISAGKDSSTYRNKDKWFPGLDVTASGGSINRTLKDIGSFNVLGQDINVGKLGKLPDNFFMRLRMLEQNGVANIQSRPSLSTLNGYPASLKIGTIQYYVFKDILPVNSQSVSVVSTTSNYLEQQRFQKIEAFISFEITPWVGPDNQLTLDIKPSFQTPKGEFTSDLTEIPSINTRTLESTVRIKNGETIVLGGLIQEIESTTITKFPILGDIPLIGELFTDRSKQKTKTELIIYVTPKIYYEDEFNNLYFDN